MVLVFDISAKKVLDIQPFCRFLGVENLVVDEMQDDNGELFYALHRPSKSTTSFLIEQREEDGYTVSFDPLSSYDDYKLLPYLLDSLSQWLNGEPYHVSLQTEEGTESQTVDAYHFYNEDWMQTQIGDAIAYAKCVMSLHLPFHIELTPDYNYVTESMLNQYGVDLHSSTPRIYGYIQYLLRNSRLPKGENDFEEELLESKDIEVDVPQHESIGSVQSWQTDGSVTTESFCAQDIALLVNIGQRYLSGAEVDGVVLNDLGTIFQEGIGVDKNVDVALNWYNEAIKNGDRWFAPSNVGDIYRKGWSSEGIQLEYALANYQLSNDPYAWYRIGQSYEEGWTAEPDMDKAMRWYKKAAEAGHHLAVKRLAQDSYNS